MANEVSLKNTVDDVRGRGNYDATIMATVNGQQVGYLSYNVYQDQPAIKMIWVEPEHRRQKIALRMLKELQKTYPESEIDWGYTTPQGTELKRSIKFRTRPNIDVIQAIEKLNAIRSKLKQMNYKLERLQQTDIEAARRYAQTVGDRWNKLNDLEYKLENRLSSMGSPYSKFIDDQLNESVDESIRDLCRLAGIGGRKLNDVGSNISLTASEKACLMKKHNIKPGTPEWFQLWFSKPYLTGEKPI